MSAAAEDELPPLEADHHHHLQSRIQELERQNSAIKEKLRELLKQQSLLPSTSNAETSVESPGQTAEEGEEIAASIPASAFGCPICLRLLYDPVCLTSCGHSFCRECLIEAFNRSTSFLRCPLCRAPCPDLKVESAAPNALFHSVLQNYFARLYRERRAEVQTQRSPTQPRYGVFISDRVHFPGETMHLFIYEPRYRILMNKALNTNRLFIVACHTRPHLPYAQSPASANRVYSSRDGLAAGLGTMTAAVSVGGVGGIRRIQPRQQQQHPRRDPRLYPGMARRRPNPPQPQQQQQQDGEEEENGQGRAAAAPVDGDEVPVDLLNLEHQFGVPGTEQLPIAENCVGCKVRILTVFAEPDGRMSVRSVVEGPVRLSKIRSERDSYGLVTAEAVPREELPFHSEQREASEDHPPAAIEAEEEAPEVDVLDEIGDEGEEVKLQQGVEESNGGHRASVGASPLRQPSTSESSETMEDSLSEGPKATLQTLEDAKALAARLQDRFQAYLRASITAMSVVESIHGPPPDDLVHLSYWYCRALPGTPQLKQRCLESPDPYERLKLIETLIEEAMKNVSRRSKAQSFVIALILVLGLLFFAQK